jgi:YVTN family beta-propeller protein
MTIGEDTAIELINLLHRQGQNNVGAETSGSAVTISLPNVFSTTVLTLDANAVITMPVPEGDEEIAPGARKTLYLVQDGVGSRVPTWAGATINWINGSPPTLQTTADAVDILEFESTDGTTWNGIVVAPIVSGGGGSITSVFGRTTPAIISEDGDYTAAQITHAADLSNTGTQTFAGAIDVTGAFSAGTYENLPTAVAEYFVDTSHPLQSQAPSFGQVLVWNSSAWAPETPAPPFSYPLVAKQVAPSFVQGPILADGSVHQPYATAVSPDGKTLYATYSSTGVVGYWDIETNTLTGTISGSVGTTPEAMIMTPDGSQLWVADSAGDAVYVIDTATKTVIESVAVGNNPSALCFYNSSNPASPDGGPTILVANFTDNTVDFVHALTYTVYDTVSVGAGPVAIACSYTASVQGAWFLVSNQTDGTVSYWSNDNGTATLSLPGGAVPAGVAISPDSTTGYVLDRGNFTIAPIDLMASPPTLGSPVSTGGFPQSTILLTANGQYGYTAGSGFGAGAVYLWSLAEGIPSFVSEIWGPGSTTLTTLALSPNQSTLFIPTSGLQNSIVPYIVADPAYTTNVVIDDGAGDIFGPGFLKMGGDIRGGGRLIVGNAANPSPTQMHDLSAYLATDVGVTNEARALKGYWFFDPTEDYPDSFVLGGDTSLIISGSSGGAGASALGGGLQYNSSGDLTSYTYGFASYVETLGSGSITGSASAGIFTIEVSGDGGITTGVGVDIISGNNGGAGTIGDLIGVRVQSPALGGGGITNNTGILVEDQSGVSGAYALKTLGGIVSLGTSTDEVGVYGSTTTQGDMTGALNSVIDPNAKDVLQSIVTALANFGLAKDDTT